MTEQRRIERTQRVLGDIYTQVAGDKGWAAAHWDTTWWEKWASMQRIRDILQREIYLQVQTGVRWRKR